ncbi:hypothetical protein ACFC96_24765 [Streptomyces sp. NPDC055955]|uniref:hypothetical protein n=1 Tax=Streptomyces sp. NPDC055955 TaxID=3345665 RepID=UPI0035E1845E
MTFATAGHGWSHGATASDPARAHLRANGRRRRLLEVRPAAKAGACGTADT